MTARCEADSGSATGNRPTCDQPATVAVTVKMACYPAYSRFLCATHARGEAARVYPSTVTTTPIGA